MITPRLEEVWPDVERRLRALLRRRGVDRASVDDVVQEVALRALSHGVTFTCAKDLFRWAAPVACNLHVDLLRQRARMLDDPAADERPASDDVAREVAHRIELQRAFRGIAALRPADRAAIMDAVAAEPATPRNRQEAVRLAVRRHRARSRLAVVLEQLAAFVTGARAVVRGRRAVAVALVPAAALPLLLGVPGMRREGVAHTPTTVRPVALTPAVATRYAADAVRSGIASGGSGAAGRTAAAPHAAARAKAGPSRPESVARVETPVGVAVHAREARRRPDVLVGCAGGLPVLPEVCV